MPFVHIQLDGDNIHCIGSNRANSNSRHAQGPIPTVWNFKKQWVIEQLARNNLSFLRGNQIVLHTLEHGDVVYRIVRGPGAYCDHCGERVGDGPLSTRGRPESEHAEILEKVRERAAYLNRCQVRNSEEESGNPNNPSGVKIINTYDCVLDEIAPDG